MHDMAATNMTNWTLTFSHDDIVSLVRYVVVVVDVDARH